jgi:pimeloyl-[acyl-carrier protein] methyl ester esterase
MSRVLLIHGWGFDAALWNHVNWALLEHECLTLDFGYFAEPRLDIPARLDLVVGHSFGSLWAMLHPELRGIPLLVISGFPRFSACADFPHGTPARVLARMLKRLWEAPEEVVKSFRERCGDTTPFPPFDIKRLARDLERLREDDARDLPERQPRLALAAADDPLLPRELSEQAFPGVLHLVEEGGHLLPLTKPALVADFIRKGLEQP